MRPNKLSTSLSPSSFDGKGSVSSRSFKTYRPENISEQQKEDLNKRTLSNSDQERLKSEVSLMIRLSFLVVLIILGLVGMILFGELNF